MLPARDDANESLTVDVRSSYIYTPPEISETFAARGRGCDAPRVENTLCMTTTILLRHLRDETSVQAGRPEQVEGR